MEDYFKNVDIALKRKLQIFELDYSATERGLYVSRIDDDVTTYELLTKTPNIGSIMESATYHSLCHLFLEYIENSQYSRKVIYFGPTSAQTGFTLMVRGMDHSSVILMLRRAFEFIRDYVGDMPKSSPQECSNYKDHDLDSARKEATLFLPVLNRWEPDMLVSK